MNHSNLSRAAALLVTGLVFRVLFMPMLAAGQEATLHTGERIRVTMQYPTTGPSYSRARFIGTFAAASADSLSLITEAGRRMTFPQTNVGNVEMSRGHRSGAGTGALVGAGIGGIVLGALAAASEEENPCLRDGPCIDFSLSRGDAFVVGFLGGAALGALLGLAVGSTARVEKWTSIFLVSDTGAGALIHARGGGLMLRF